MRFWWVAGVVLIVALGIFAMRGSAPVAPPLPSCEGPNCVVLAINLIEGKNGPPDIAEGHRLLEQGCKQQVGSGCFLLGHYALEGPLDGGAELALDAFSRGCALRYFDACAFSGMLKESWPRRDRAGAAADLSKACDNDSALGCTLLGERVLKVDPASFSERRESARSFARGCELGNEHSCLRHAQAIACGRNESPDPAAALALVSRLCAKADDDSCEQRLKLEPSGAQIVAYDNPALESALLRDAFEAAALEDSVTAHQRAESLHGGVGLFARALVAMRFDELDRADACFAQLDGGEGHPELQVARATLALRREGKPWAEATWLAWRRAGSPELRKAAWLPEVRPFGDRGVCVPFTPVAAPKTGEEFIREVAATDRSALDAPFDKEVVHAALRFSTSEELAVRLLALNVLASVARDPEEKETREFEASARRAFAAEHRDTLFFRLLNTPSDLRTRDASDAEVADLEEALSLPMTPPHRLLFDAFKRALGEDAKAEQRAFLLTVNVSTELFQLRELSSWLERGGQPVARRARILSRLGEAVSNGTWLVEGYIGMGLLQNSLALKQDAEVARKHAASKARLEHLRTGAGGVQSVGVWPWPIETDSVERLVEDEMGELARLQALRDIGLDPRPPPSH